MPDVQDISRDQLLEIIKTLRDRGATAEQITAKVKELQPRVIPPTPEPTFMRRAVASGINTALGTAMTLANPTGTASEAAASLGAEALQGHPLKALARAAGVNPENLYNDVKAGRYGAAAGDVAVPALMLAGPKVAKVGIPAMAEAPGAVLRLATNPRATLGSVAGGAEAALGAYATKLPGGALIPRIRAWGQAPDIASRVSGLSQSLQGEAFPVQQAVIDAMAKTPGMTAEEVAALIKLEADLRVPAVRSAVAEKAQNQTASGRVAVEKAHQAAIDLRAREARQQDAAQGQALAERANAEKAQTQAALMRAKEAREAAAAQEAANKEKGTANIAQDQAAKMLEAEAEAAREEEGQRAAAAAIEAAKAGREPTPPTIRETTTAETPTGRQTMTRQFVEPEQTANPDADVLAAASKDLGRPVDPNSPLGQKILEANQALSSLQKKGLLKANAPALRLAPETPAPEPVPETPPTTPEGVAAARMTGARMRQIMQNVKPVEEMGHPVPQEAIDRAMAEIQAGRQAPPEPASAPEPTPEPPAPRMVSTKSKNKGLTLSQNDIEAGGPDLVKLLEEVIYPARKNRATGHYMDARANAVSARDIAGEAQIHPADEAAQSLLDALKKRLENPEEE